MTLFSVVIATLKYSMDSKSIRTKEKNAENYKKRKNKKIGETSKRKFILLFLV